MKTKFLSLVVTLAVTGLSFAQKDELKALEKAIKGANLQEIESASKTAEAAVANSTDDFKAQFYFTKAKAYASLAEKNVAKNQSLDTAAETLGQLFAFEKSTGKDKYSKQAVDMMNTVKNELFNVGEKGFENKAYNISKKAFESVYKMSKADTVALYNASLAALNDKDYNDALEKFNELNALGYTGITKQFYATDKATGKEDAFPDKLTRDLIVKGGSHIKPRDGKSESKKGEIIRLIALIYKQNGDTEKAKDAFKEARKANPTDSDLYINELRLYIEDKDSENFEKLVSEAMQIIPKDEDLLFYLGLFYYELENYDKSKYYLSELFELNNIYKNVNYIYGINYLMGINVLAEDKIVYEKMNNLGNSAADNIKYKELESQRQELLKSSIPYFKAELNNNIEKLEILNQLKRIYIILMMEDEANKTQLEIDALEKK